MGVADRVSSAEERLTDCVEQRGDGEGLGIDVGGDGLRRLEQGEVCEVVELVGQRHLEATFCRKWLMAIGLWPMAYAENFLAF